MITYEQLQEAHDLITQCVIRAIFDDEDSFKREVLQYCRAEEAEIERVHCANAFRITLKFEDYSERDVYVDHKEVYSWFMSKYEQANK